MTMHNPPHPGEFIREIYLEPFGLSSRFLAAKLDVSPSTLSRVLQGTSGISPEMALRLSKALGRSPESWLAMQDNYDLWQARQRTNLENVDKVEFETVESELKNAKLANTMEPVPPIVDHDTPANVLVPLIRYSKCILVSKKSKIIGIITASDTLKMME